MNISKTILTSVLITSVALFSACSEEKKAPVKKEIPALAVNTVTVKNEPVPIWKQYTGMTKASSDQDVRVRVSGILEKIYFHDGQEVKKGQKLFKIQQAEYIAALNAAKAKKRQDEASLALAKADVARYEPLVEEGLAPRATLEQYQAQEAGLRAAIAGDTAEINRAELDLSYTIITAPISGYASARRVDVGNLVGLNESTLLTTIVSTDPIYAYFSPSQKDVRMFQKYRNKENPIAFIEVPGSEENIRLDGFVDFKNNSVDPLTSTITMRATINNKEGKVLPGTFVYINLFINDKYKFLMVYIEDENHMAKRVDIETNYSTRFYASVSKGLKDGDKLIVSSLVKLRTGIKLISTDTTATDGIKAILQKNNLVPKKK
ncbi:RND efflux system, membrane fusion protein CmeA [hydrothermal vent metagenome]|uniref:RND efflux system, membrane fusion protein CmeA n=1 Tax=hydrothermal vent metagenome TaxID=652676 RepID=A0A1W1CPW8_9ZZZZ